MAKILEILQYGHPTLREVCAPVQVFDEELATLLEDMKRTLKEGGIGLAAPQVGRPIQLITIDIPSSDKTTTYISVNGERCQLEDIMPLDFINPVIEPYGPKSTYTEGCLSIRDVYAPIKRRSKVRAILPLVDGRTLKLECNGLLARCLQHENDHLHGILFTDHIDKEPQ
jgi:peptide deformylase